MNDNGFVSKCIIFYFCYAQSREDVLLCGKAACKNTAAAKPHVQMQLRQSRNKKIQEWFDFDTAPI